jgi:hypothetical protein
LREAVFVIRKIKMAGFRRRRVEGGRWRVEGGRGKVEDNLMIG